MSHNYQRHLLQPPRSNPLPTAQPCSHDAWRARLVSHDAKGARGSSRTGSKPLPHGSNMAAALRFCAARVHRCSALLSLGSSVRSSRAPVLSHYNVHGLRQPAVLAARSFTDAANSTEAEASSAADSEEIPDEAGIDRRGVKTQHRKDDSLFGNARYKRIVNKLGTITTKSTLLVTFDELLKRGEADRRNRAIGAPVFSWLAFSLQTWSQVHGYFCQCQGSTKSCPIVCGQYIFSPGKLIFSWRVPLLTELWAG